MVSAGTKALLRNGSMISGTVPRPADSGVLAAMPMAAKTPESAGLGTVPLIMLPFLSSAFVPADTMKTGVKQFAEYQPFTPIIETLRDLLGGHHPSTAHLLATLA